MKKVNLFRIVVLLQICCLAYACSSDDGNDGVNSDFDTNAQLSLVEVNATSVEVNLDRSSIANMGIGIRKQGETSFQLVSEYGAFGDTGAFDALEPAQNYEMTLLIKGLDKFPFEILKFTTLPFNVINSNNSEIRTYNIFSEKGFVHEFTPDTFNDKADLKFYFVDEADPTVKKELKHQFIDNKITFTVPENSVSDTPYEEFHNYNLGYQVGNGDLEFITTTSNSEDLKLVYTVFNPNPQITELRSIESLSGCGSNGGYELNFRGHFFSSFDSVDTYYEKSTAIITRIDDGSEFIIQEESFDCLSYDRLWLKDLIEMPSGMVKKHTDKLIRIGHPRGTTPGAVFDSGDYKIKITFSKDVDDFFETNDFSFTLP